MTERVFFGTDGMRGKANVGIMTCEMAVALGRAVTHYFQKSKHQSRPLIVIGKDTRLSCYMLEQAFSAGVCSQGGRGILTGPLPTPGVAFATHSMRADAGVMISASHNEFSDNGIKIFDRTGHKLPDDVEKHLEKLLLNPQLIPQKVGEELGNTKRLDEVIGRYVVHAKSVFPSTCDLESFRLVVDCAHGAAYRVAPIIFSELGAEVIPLGVNPDGKNINDHVGAMFPNKAREEVLQQKAHVGICLDGDGDRLALIDHQGNLVEGDRILGILASLMLDRQELNPGDTVVGTILTNMGIEKYLKEKGLLLKRTKVGDRYVIEEMKKHHSLLGGEPSGHTILRQYTSTGDGIIVALKVLEAMIYYKKTLYDLSRNINLFPQVSRNVQVQEKIPFEQRPRLMKELKLREQLLHDCGRIILRYSGTESKIRLMIEGEQQSVIEQMAIDLEDIIREECR
jgi:phosphoglucosamine mutase